MADNVLLNKAATIERCVQRVREEWAQDPEGFMASFSRQDAAILNLQRAFRGPDVSLACWAGAVRCLP